MSQAEIFNTLPAATLRRRLGAMLYDSMLLIPVEMLVLLIVGLINLFVFEGERGVPDILTILLGLLVAAWFFVWFWTHGGKTTGMQAWRLNVRDYSGNRISQKQAWIRVTTACFGLANIWKLFDKNNQGWHERLSRTVVVYDKDRTLM